MGGDLSRQPVRRIGVGIWPVKEYTLFAPA